MTSAPHSPLVAQPSDHIKQRNAAKHRLLAQKELSVKFANSVPALADFNPSPARGPFQHECYDFMLALERHVDLWRAEKAKLEGRS